MIPQQLTLHNFFSYREAHLDFRGLHVACVCGPNGAGKSSLLEAIAWAVWGQSRAATEDDVIHLGTLAAQVDFVFSHQQEIYRIIRSRHRQQGGHLEFQVQTEAGFRSLTRRGMRATQQFICETLRLDYETFVNSAYLRQGRADDFMVKRPGERKQILADLLKLSQYDHLAEKAKGRWRQAQAQVEVLTPTLAQLQTQLDQRSALRQEMATLEAQLAEWQAQQQADQAQSHQLQAVQRRRQDHQQALALQRQRATHLAQQRSQVAATLTQQQHQAAALAATVAEADPITAGWQRWRALQAQEETLAQQGSQVQALQQQQQTLQTAHGQAIAAVEQQQHQAQSQLTWLDQQLADLATTLQKQDAVAAAQAQLQAARAQLQALDQRQLAAAPLWQRQQQLQAELDRAQAHLTAQIAALDRAHQQLQQDLASQPQLQQAAVAVGYTLDQLAARRAYQEQVREKGLERRSFMERLQANQRHCELQLAQLDEKLQALQDPQAVCPLCDRPLDDLHWQLVRNRHKQEREEVQQDIWAIREQLAVSEREIQVLRQEYRDLEAELAHYGDVLEQRGHLQAQLASSQSAHQRLASLTAERQHLAQCLHQGHYGDDLRQALATVTAELAALAYDERDHALARGQVDRLRWAEIKQADIKQAQRKQAQLQAQRPALVAAIAALATERAHLAQSPQAQALQDLERQIQALGYSLAQHQQVRADLRAAQPWADRYAALEQARQTLPAVQQQIQTLTQQDEALAAALAEVQAEIDQRAGQLAQLADPQPELTVLAERLAQHQRQREAGLARLGALQQQLTHLDQLETQAQEQQRALLAAKGQIRVYQELAIAFGRNGLQSLLIETILPQLETETNHILSRLSAHQLHVQFITQRAGRNRSKLIDTLDILIADAQGTRPYETYSGGEAFRVNFAIRLALARLLAQRSGTPLQLLIVDEGFGTQDHEGCDRLVGAINAIAADFSCILAVTHVPHFREAFQTRIDVFKTPDGSQLQLSL
ncbi:MAG: exonuclease subunit SbcC [Leptolyngbya sp.]|nr:exonuclease subunit SbcC [Leptolyngbya sp.]